MNLSKKLHTVLLLIAVFSASFLTVFLAIILTQSAYSTPSNNLSTINGMDIILGPPPNSTNVPLDTTITVDALASAALNDLHVTPELPIARVYSEATSALTYQTTFYPAQLLKPSTSYNVSVTIMGGPLWWSFTTTSEPFSPSVSFLLATNALWIGLAVATSATAIVGFAFWFKKKRV